MKKTRFILLLCALTAAAWSLPGLAQAKGKHPAPSAGGTISSMFDGGAAYPGSMFDGGSSFDGGSMFDGG